MVTDEPTVQNQKPNRYDRDQQGSQPSADVFLGPSQSHVAADEQQNSHCSLLRQLDVAPRQVLIDAKIYEVELTSGVSLKLSEPREGQITMRQTGDRVQVAPTSPDVCNVFPAS